MPDLTLIQLAAAGKLHEPAVLGEQVDRMLVDSKSQRFVQNSIRLWRNLDHIGEMPVSTDFVSFFRDNIDAAMRAETETFFRHILDKNLSPREFIARLHAAVASTRRATYRARCQWSDQHPRATRQASRQ